MMYLFSNNVNVDKIQIINVDKISCLVPNIKVCSDQRWIVFRCFIGARVGRGGIRNMAAGEGLQRQRVVGPFQYFSFGVHGLFPDLWGWGCVRPCLLWMLRDYEEREVCPRICKYPVMHHSRSLIYTVQLYICIFLAFSWSLIFFSF